MEVTISCAWTLFEKIDFLNGIQNVTNLVHQPLRSHFQIVLFPSNRKMGLINCLFHADALELEYWCINCICISFILSGLPASMFSCFQQDGEGLGVRIADD